PAGAWNMRPTAVAGGRGVACFVVGLAHRDIIFRTRITVMLPIHSPRRAHRGRLLRILRLRRTDRAPRFPDALLRQRIASFRNQQTSRRENLFVNRTIAEKVAATDRHGGW